ncbi:MAG TPA: GreA/GreB family elongation factor [Candidatus Eremiobacteraceae bacterium]|jgi:transcription elongation GreA/GreB family factor
MSRAFVKEPDGDSPGDDLPESPVSSGPNYVTAKGLADLHARLATAQSLAERLFAGDGNPAAKSALTRARADVRRLQRRLDAAVLVETEANDVGEVALGVRVTIEHPDGRRQTYTIVGEDEADPVNGLVSWASPLGKALLGKREGNTAMWLRPAGDVEVKIVAVSV